MKSYENPYAKAVLFIWAGALIGVSLIATPAKFLVLSLDLSVALQIGQITFSIFNKFEWFCWALLLIISWDYDNRRLFNIPVLASLLFILVMQTFWLLPVLGTHIDAIMNKIPTEPSYHHMLYVVLEGCKILMIIVFALKKNRD